MEKQKTEKPKYPGVLGKKTPKLNALAAQLIDKDEWLAEIEAEMLVNLLDHYQIPLASGVSKWFALALALARDNILAFQINNAKRRGRPRSKKQITEPNSRGRPTKYHIENHENLVGSVDLFKRALMDSRKAGVCLGYDKVMCNAIREELKELGGARITDLSAIRALLRSYAKNTNRAFYNVVFEVPRLQKRLSESRSIIRKIQGNYSK